MSYDNIGCKWNIASMSASIHKLTQSSDLRGDVADRNYLAVFFDHLGLRSVADLRDIDAFEPVSNYLRSSLESFQRQQPQEQRNSQEGAGAVRAALGRLIRSIQDDGGVPVQVQPSAPVPRQQSAPGGYAVQVKAPPVSTPPVPISGPPGMGQLPFQASVAAARGRNGRQPQQQKQSSGRAVSPSWGVGPNKQLAGARIRQTSPCGISQA
ncbi:unnamed protein product, partial [Polarella glacialis]